MVHGNINLVKTAKFAQMLSWMVRGVLDGLRGHNRA
jgi:hypothetical protein